MDSSSQHNEPIRKSRFRIFHRLKRNDKSEAIAYTVCKPAPVHADEQIDVQFLCQIENVSSPDDIDISAISRELIQRGDNDTDYDELREFVEEFIRRCIRQFHKTQEGPEWLKFRNTNLLTFYSLFLKGCFKHLKNRLIIIDGTYCYEMDYVRNEVGELAAFNAIAQKFPNYATVMASQGYLDSTWHSFKQMPTDAYPNSDPFIGVICTNPNAWRSKVSTCTAFRADCRRTVRSS